MVTDVHRNHKAYQGREEGGGEGVRRRGEEGDCIPIATLSPLTRMTQEGSDESRFNVSLIVRDKVTRHSVLKRKEIRTKSNRGLSAYQPNALPLGQTGFTDTKFSSL